MAVEFGYASTVQFILESGAEFSSDESVQDII
jgi:hypothetical protein